MQYWVESQTYFNQMAYVWNRCSLKNSLATKNLGGSCTWCDLLGSSSISPSSSCSFHLTPLAWIYLDRCYNPGLCLWSNCVYSFNDKVSGFDHHKKGATLDLINNKTSIAPTITFILFYAPFKVTALDILIGSRQAKLRKFRQCSRQLSPWQNPTLETSVNLANQPIFFKCSLTVSL